jgi:hypothetical protein
MKYIEKLKQNTELDFGIGANDDEIILIEVELDIILPKDYKAFLSECGMCNFGDTHINGILKTDKKIYFPIIDTTKLLRNESNLSKEFIVLNYEVDEYVELYKISNDGEDLGIYGASIIYDDENKIGKIKKLYQNFDEYIFEYFIKLGEE